MKPLFVLPLALAFAVMGTGSEAKTAKTRRTQAQPAATRAAPNGNINVPSTDFSTIEQPGDGTEDRSRQGTMRPAITDSGQLGMGTGF